MGQSAVGILYGCKAPDLPAPDGWEDGDSPAHQLVERWENANGITWGTKGPKVSVEGDDDTQLIGVWVAIGGSGKDDAPYFLEQCVALDMVDIAFAKSIRKATKLWVRFAAWAEKEGVQLPTPKLWLTPGETA